MCTSKNAVPDNFETTKNKETRLLAARVHEVVGTMPEVRAANRWWRKSKSPRQRHRERGKAMDRRAARWNWLERLDPGLTMFAVFLLFGAAWILRSVWVSQ